MVLSLSEEQIKQGMEVCIGSIAPSGYPKKPIEADAESMGLPVQRVSLAPGLRMANIRLLSNWLQERAFSVVHTHGYKANVLTALTRSHSGRAKHVATLHGWTNDGRLGRNAVYELIDRLLLGRPDAVVVVSHQMARLASLRRVRSLHVIENGMPKIGRVAVPSSAQSELIRWVSTCPTLVCIGRLSSEKDFATAIEAMAILRRKNYKLLIIGDGPQRANLQSIACRLELQEKVHFAGYVPNAWEMLPYCLALVVTSRTEGLPMNVLEAMRAKTPIMSTGVGGIPEVTGGLRGAWFFDVGDASGLARGIDDMSVNRSDRENRAQFAFERWSIRYSIERAALQYEAVYRDVSGIKK